MASLRFSRGMMAPLSDFLNALRDFIQNQDSELIDAVIESPGIIPGKEKNPNDPIGSPFRPSLAGASTLQVEPGKALWFITEVSPRGNEFRYIFVKMDNPSQVDLSGIESGETKYVYASVGEYENAPYVKMANSEAISGVMKGIYIDHIAEINLGDSIPSNGIAIARVSNSGSGFQIEDLRYMNIFRIRDEIFGALPPYPRLLWLDQYVTVNDPKDVDELETKGTPSVSALLKVGFAGEVYGGRDPNNQYRFVLKTPPDSGKYLTDDEIPESGTMWGYVLEVGGTKYQIVSVSKTDSIANGGVSFEVTSALPEGDSSALIYPDAESIEITLYGLTDSGSKKYGSRVIDIKNETTGFKVEFGKSYQISARLRNKGLYSSTRNLNITIQDDPTANLGAVQNLTIANQGSFPAKNINWVHLTWNWDDNYPSQWLSSIQITWVYDNETKKDSKIIAAKQEDGSLVTEYYWTHVVPGQAGYFVVQPISITGIPGQIARTPVDGNVTIGNLAPPTISDPKKIPGAITYIVKANEDDTASYAAETGIVITTPITDGSNITPPTDLQKVEFGKRVVVPIDLDQDLENREIWIFARSIAQEGAPSDWARLKVPLDVSDPIIKTQGIYHGTPHDVASEVVVARGNTASLSERIESVVDEDGAPSSDIMLRTITVPLIVPTFAFDGDPNNSDNGPFKGHARIDDTGAETVMFMFSVQFYMNIQVAHATILTPSDGTHPVDILLYHGHYDSTSGSWTIDYENPDITLAFGGEAYKTATGNVLVTPNDYVWIYVRTYLDANGNPIWPRGALIIEYLLANATNAQKKKWPVVV